MRRAAYCLVLLLCLSPLLSAQDAPPLSPEGMTKLFEPERMRLLAIFDRLQAISMILDSKLADSEANLTTLSEELAALRQELSELKAKLEASENRSAKLEEALAKSEALLEKAEQSFAIYRRESEIKIAALELKAARWKIAGIAGLGIGIGGLIFALTR